MKILIVDEEPGLASGLAQWLAENGWGTPGIAATSDQAVEWINQNGGIDVLVTDVVIQPADGITLRDTIQPHLPNLKTIFISAHDLSAYASRFGDSPLLAKPVTGEALDGAIRALFEPKPAPVIPTPAPVQAVAATPQPVAAAPQPVAATPRAAAPTASPIAVASATPKPVAVQATVAGATPKPVATSTPRPVAAPPVAVGATPTPIAAKPAVVAQPAPVAAQPSVVAQPAPVAAQPSVAATPKPVAAQAKAVAATPRPVAQAVAAPQASPKAAVAQASATPRAAGAGTPAPASAVAKSATSKRTGLLSKAAMANMEVEMPPDELVGTVIGNYQIEAKIGLGSQGGIYRALQTNIGRHVRFYALDLERAQNPEEIQRFIANASVKANVTHPYIFAVYEAGESSGVYFYSCEYVPCRTLRQLREAGMKLDENTALQTLKVAAEVLGYFTKSNITHNIISENGLLISANNRPRVANIAAYQPTQDFDVSGEMQKLGSIIGDAVVPDAKTLGVPEFARSLASGEKAYPSWPVLAQAIEALEPTVAPEDAYKLDAQERAAIRMVEMAKQKQKKAMVTNMIVSLSLLAVLLGVVWYFFLRQRGADARSFNRMAFVPAGEFIYQAGQKETLPDFWIDEYEVTIAQYAEFLQYLKDHPDEVAKFEHPNQPKGKSHVPAEWADQDLSPPFPGYYQRAQKWGAYKGAPLDVNSPVFGVDWFDAYAYAKWKGKRLPTEKEWEKAARGTAGIKYPWGNEDKKDFANVGYDYDPNPKKGGEIDGYDRVSPVDAMKKDKSPFKVMGMGGNVSEWTATYDVDPKMGGAKIPVIRGGSFKDKTPEGYEVTKRLLLITDLDSGEALGFRTVSDTKPPEVVK